MSDGPNDAGPSSEGAPNEPRLITVVVKSATDTQDFQVAQEITVRQLKEEAAPRFMANKDHMLMIFAGKVLRNQETLLQHNIQDGFTVHLVVRKPEPSDPSALYDHSVEPCCSTPAPSGIQPPPPSISNMPEILESARNDLAALLEVLAELPQHFQAWPELMHEVVQSPTIQGIISNGSCGPLATAFILAVATLIALSASKPSVEKEQVVSAKEIAQALGTTGSLDMLASTKEMAHFLSETPEFQQFAQDTPQFGRLMSPSGLTKLMVIYKKLPHLSVVDPEADMTLAGDLLDEVRSFHQLIADICKVLSSPETQEELEERMLRHSIMTSASLQQLAQRNVQIGHLLSNPQVVRQMVKYIRSPEVRHEMDRHCDRTLKNLESLPGGYNFLHHLYTEVEEPIWHIMQEKHEGRLLAPLERGSLDLQGRHVPPGMENRSPLPDPWAPRLDAASPRTGKSSSKRSKAAKEGSSSLTGEPERPPVAPGLDQRSEASPSLGMTKLYPASEEQAISSFCSSSQAREEDHTVQEQAAGTGSEQHEEPPEMALLENAELVENPEGLVETEDGHNTAMDTPAGSESSS